MNEADRRAWDARVNEDFYQNDSKAFRSLIFNYLGPQIVCVSLLRARLHRAFSTIEGGSGGWREEVVLANGMAPPLGELDAGA